jgi:hypothetical protein
MVIKAQIIEILVRAGREPGFDVSQVPAEMESVRSEDAINRLHWREWDRVTGGMVIEDVIALAKALTVCEERFRWSGGSVAAVIWVYREVERRDRELAQHLAVWVLARTSNAWVPFGSMNLGARSVEEYRALGAAAAKNKAATACLEGEGAAAGKVRREERIRAAVRRQAEQVKATEDRREWVSELVSLPTSEQLRRIADDTGHSLDYFPTSCAEVDPAAARSLDPEVRRRLLGRLEGRRKGPWKRLRLVLLRVGD